MNDQSELQTAEASFFVEDAEFSESALAAAGESYARGQASAPLENAPLDQSNLARRIHDNLNWAHLFDVEASPTPPVDLWPEIKALWAKPEEEFVTGLYDVLLGRPPEPSNRAKMCVALAKGASRFALVRTIALSDEAVFSQLDVSCLAQVDDAESNAVWEKMQSLWGKPDRLFVAGLYPLLLVRPPDWMGVAAHCRAMKAGAPRACVVRAVALSDEAQMRGLSLSWLPRLETLPPPPPRPPLLSLSWLKAAIRRWRQGEKIASNASPSDAVAALQPIGAAAEGGGS
jgi:hypothetical protein